MADFEARVTAAAVDQVRRLFNPRSVALIGATDKSRWSWSIFGNLKLHGFAGPVYLVNPRGVPVHGQDSYARVADLPEPVDLAFVMVPTSAVLGVLAEVADAGIPSVVLLTSGFAEVGEEGAELERQVVDWPAAGASPSSAPTATGSSTPPPASPPTACRSTTRCWAARSGSCCRAGRSPARC